MTEIYLCRHGETAWSKSGQHTSFTDLPLTEGGREEIEWLKMRLSGIPFSRVFASPLKRAKESAILCGYDPEIVDDLAEWNYGKYEGLTTLEIQKEFPNWTIFNDGAEGGESVAEVSQRADRMIEMCLKLDGNVALFSSGHFSRVLGARWLGLSAGDGRSFALSTASLSILGYEREVPVLKLWNERKER